MVHSDWFHGVCFNMWIDASRYLESLRIAELPSQKACIISQTIGWEPLCDAQIVFLSWYLH